jgi:DNA topoisomerase-1
MWILEGGAKPQWQIFRHNGPLFPPEYIPHQKPIIFKGEEILLPSLAEEYASLYSKYINTEYIEKPKFNKNFFKDFKKVLPDNLKNSVIEDFDFSIIKEHIDRENEKKKEMSKEEKEAIKKRQDVQEEPYKYCVINGAQQKVGNYKIEPPGIFLGRGEHPKLGMIKRRIYPKDIILNLDKEAPIPKIQIKNMSEDELRNQKWGDIIHDNSVIWLATWKDNITNKNKYIFTSMESIFKSKSDESKFDLAKKLKRKAAKIRETYIRQLDSDDNRVRQLATALYFIDNLALRVGGKKDKKEEADTVGVTSLRVEHISLLPPNIVKLDFLAKDSVRFCKKVSAIKPVFDNLITFTNNKSRKDQLFDLINPSMMNKYLDDFMKDLTAKVWRTYNASFVFQKELDKINEDKVKAIHESERINYLINMFNQANTTVALLCNHQKNVSNKLDEQVDKLVKKIKELQKKKKKYLEKKKRELADKINSKIKLAKLKKDNKMRMKNVSLGTSKMNYIDPRIIFAFIKKFDIPPEKLFTAVLLKRFDWASKVEKDYRF